MTTVCSGDWDHVWSEGMAASVEMVKKLFSDTFEEIEDLCVEKVEKIFKDFIEEIYEECSKGAKEWRVTIKNNVEAVINAHIDDDFQLLFSNIST